jgi:hypothetical protein
LTTSIMKFDPWEARSKILQAGENIRAAEKCTQREFAVTNKKPVLRKDRLNSYTAMR